MSYRPFKIIALFFVLLVAFEGVIAHDNLAKTPPPAGSISLNKLGVFTANYITYVFILTNTGTTVITSYALTDLKVGITNLPVTLPPGGLLPGNSLSYSVKYILKQADKDAGVVNNSAIASCIDAGGASLIAGATASVTVPKSPVALDDAGQTTINQPVTINILKNDYPGNSIFIPPTVTITILPLHGTVSVNIDGSVVYTPYLNFNGPDSFSYRVRDAYGYFTNEAKVNITQTLVVGALRVPNLFTPNGDGVNDTFEIRGIDQYYSNEVIISNRWGNQVYHSTNYKNDWDGAGLSEGTYFYIVKVQRTVNDEQEIYKGYVTLARPR